jgi:hypothetical protein
VVYRVLGHGVASPGALRGSVGPSGLHLALGAELSGGEEEGLQVPTGFYRGFSRERNRECLQKGLFKAQLPEEAQADTVLNSEHRSKDRK